MRLEEIWGREVLCLDGAMGTMIQATGASFTTAPEYLNVTHPQIIMDIHKAYVNAGVHIIETNTFGANRVKLANYGLEAMVYRLNMAGVNLAKEAAKGRVLVAGSMGPTGKFLEPVGDLSFSQAVEAFKEQAMAFRDGGADIVMVETMSDIKEAKAAIIAVREVMDVPIFVLATFQEDLHTLLGMSPEAVAVTLEAMGVWALGANCSLGPEGIFEVAKRMAGVTSHPLVFMPNAGLPRLEGKRTVFPSSPKEMADYAVKLVEVGAWVVGGCCGSTPLHIQEMVKRVRGMPIVRREVPPGLKLAGRRKVVFIGEKHYPAIIGERINPTGKEAFQKELRGGRTAWAQEAAWQQLQAGADLLDINVGMPGIEEERLLPLVATSVQTQADCPLVLDSSNPKAIEKALQQVEGRPLINSMTGEKDSMKALLPLALRYGAAVLLLPLDDQGIPASPEGRVKVAHRLLKSALKAGLSKESLIVDGIVMTAGAQDQGPRIALETVRSIRKRIGLPTVLGVSNVSFGLPKRDAVNAAFLSMAMEAGLDAAIINPLSERVMEAFYAAALLAGRDPKASRFLSSLSKKGEEPPTPKEQLEDPRDMLFKAVLYGDEEQAKALTIKLLGEMKPIEISNTVLIPAMEEVGRLFERSEYFLPQVMASASAMQEAFSILKDAMKGEKREPKGTVVMATVEGDIHEIGKNIVCTLLENHGFTVIDLGKNVPKEKIVAQVRGLIEKGHPPEKLVVGLSALMTTTMTEMKRVIEALRREGIQVLTMVGGAVVTPEYARKMGAQYAKDAIEAVKLVERIMKDPQGSA